MTRLDRLDRLEAPPANTIQPCAPCLPWTSLDTEGFRPMLQAPVVARSAHFVIHYQATPLRAQPEPPTSAVVHDFSTEMTPSRPQTVDNSAGPCSLGRRVLGIVVPKRHAKRSTTRNLIKRQVRATMQAQTELAGTWLVRLRQPINRQTYPSAASQALRLALHAELQSLIAQLRAKHLLAPTKAPA
jgi:ribonuclease P protein component